MPRIHLSNDHLLCCAAHCSDAGVRQLYGKSCGRDRWRFHSRHAQWEGRAGQTERDRLPGEEATFGTRAKQFTTKEAFGKEVTVKEAGYDRYGTVAEVILWDGRSLNRN